MYIHTYIRVYIDLCLFAYTMFVCQLLFIFESLVFIIYRRTNRDCLESKTPLKFSAPAINPLTTCCVFKYALSSVYVIYHIIYLGGECAYNNGCSCFCKKNQLLIYCCIFIFKYIIVHNNQPILILINLEKNCIYGFQLILIPTQGEYFSLFTFCL